MIKDSGYDHHVLPKCSSHVEHSKQRLDLNHTRKLILLFLSVFVSDVGISSQILLILMFVKSTASWRASSMTINLQGPSTVSQLFWVSWSANCWEICEWSYSSMLGVGVLYKWSLCCAHHLFSCSIFPFEFLWGCSKTVWKLSVLMNLCFFGSSSVSTSSSWASMSLLTSTSSSSGTSWSGPSSGTKARISTSSSSSSSSSSATLP